MKTLPITVEDEQLIEAAKHIILKYYKYGKHHIGAALRAKSGKIFTAVSLEANIGRVDVCAEAIVIGKAVSEGENEFDTVVAVRHPNPDEQNQEIRVVSPCGICRELISDYGADTKVIFSDNNELKKCVVLELLPYKFKRE
ncbi:MAG: cytidine deaminase [Thermoproteota archaeon]|nr:cytidine deaminase [Thermoproteota archaeon]